MFVEYWHFISRELPISETPTGFDVLPHFFYKTAIWTLFFTAMNIVVPTLAAFVTPKWYGSLSLRDRREFPSYVVCLIHHIAMVPTAWVHVYQDSLLTDEMALLVDYASLEAIVGPFCIGYLLGDTIAFAIPEAIAFRFEFIIHHILTVWLVGTAMFGPGNLLRYIPHLILCDSTNIFFNLSWLLRRSGYKGSALVTTMELLFALFFLLVRVINLPFVFLVLTLNPSSVKWGLARYSLLPIALMQWYWFSKIVTTLTARLLGTQTQTDPALPKGTRPARRKEI